MPASTDFYFLKIIRHNLTVSQQSKAACHCTGLGSIPEQSMWNLWWTSWYWDRFLSQHFNSLSVSFYQSSILTFHSSIIDTTFVNERVIK
jgi:hypothetical protein